MTAKENLLDAIQKWDVKRMLRVLKKNPSLKVEGVTDTLKRCRNTSHFLQRNNMKYSAKYYDAQSNELYSDEGVISRLINHLTSK